MKSPFLYPTHAGLRHLLNCAALFKLPAESPSSLKKLPAFLPLLLGLLLLLGGCKDLFGIKEDPVPVTTPSLPPATQIGANTFGCYVNGNLWLPYGSGLNFPLSADYDYNKRILSFGASSKTDVIRVDIYNIPDHLSAIDTFTFGSENSLEAYAEYSVVYNNPPAFTIFKTNSSMLGSLVISKFNHGLGVVSGTFNFKAINEKGDTVDLRYGRFDLKTHY